MGHGADIGTSLTRTIPAIHDECQRIELVMRSWTMGHESESDETATVKLISVDKIAGRPCIAVLPSYLAADDC